MGDEHYRKCTSSESFSMRKVQEAKCKIRRDLGQRKGCFKPVPLLVPDVVKEWLTTRKKI